METGEKTKKEEKMRRKKTKKKRRKIKTKMKRKEEVEKMKKERKKRKEKRKNKSKKKKKREGVAAKPRRQGDGEEWEEKRKREKEKEERKKERKKKRGLLARNLGSLAGCTRARNYVSRLVCELRMWQQDGGRRAGDGEEWRGGSREDVDDKEKLDEVDGEIGDMKEWKPVGCWR